jgi:hypothetical protein
MPTRKRYLVENQWFTLPDLVHDKHNVHNLTEHQINNRLNQGYRTFTTVFRPLYTRGFKPVETHEEEQMEEVNWVDSKITDASALAKQIGGDHYKQLAIQPVEFCYRNGLNNLQAEAVSYIVRAPLKGNPVQDVMKAIHTLEIWLEFLQGDAS